MPRSAMVTQSCLYEVDVPVDSLPQMWRLSSERFTQLIWSGLSTNPVPWNGVDSEMYFSFHLGLLGKAVP